MQKVILIDDEPAILQGLGVLIDWEAEGFEIVKLSPSGLDAIEYLKNNQVDLIISDIKMPEMSGLELLEKIRESHISDAYFIIISGYNDFGFVQKAIRYNCVDYVLKPVDRGELRNALSKVRTLGEEKRNAQAARQQLETSHLERNIMSLLYGKFDEVNLQYVQQNLRLSGDMNYVMLERENGALGSEQDSEEIGDIGAKQAQRRFHALCQELLGDYTGHALFNVSLDDKDYDEGLLFCNGMAEEMELSSEEYLSGFLQKLEARHGDGIRMYVGKRVCKLEDISKSFSSVHILRSLVAFHEKKRIYYYDKEAQVTSPGAVLCKESLDGLIAAIEENEPVQIRKEVDVLFSRLGQMSADQQTMDLNINYLVFQLIHMATTLDGNVDQEEILQRLSESTFEEGIARGSRVHFVKFATEYGTYLEQLRGGASKGILAEVEREVRLHYKEAISLTDLSKQFYVNSSYLGQLFRKQYGQSFKEYITNLRITEATRLLLRSEKRIAEIAEEVGYKDSDYFIRKFIEIKGCTPTKYRKTRSQNPDEN